MKTVIPEMSLSHRLTEFDLALDDALDALKMAEKSLEYHAMGKPFINPLASVSKAIAAISKAKGQQ